MNEKATMTRGMGSYGTAEGLAPSPRPRRWRWYLAGMLMTVGLVAVDRGPPASQFLASDSSLLRTAAASSEALAIRVENSYTRTLGPIGTAYPWLPAGAVVVDSRRPVTIQVVNPDLACVYHVEALELGKNETATLISEQTRESQYSWIFDNGYYEVTVSESCVIGGEDPSKQASLTLMRTTTTNKGASSRSTSQVVYAVRVRREVRELAPDDRDALLDAMAIMWQTDGDTGRAIYGSDFVSASELQVWHHVNSAQRDADHFHQGSGFFVQHVRMTLQFESSLRTIDPALTMPYWDPTIEQAATAAGTIDHLFDTELWSATWWGSIKPVAAMNLSVVDPADASFAIPDGRFARTQTMTVDEEYAAGVYVGRLRNAYNLIRAPWNNNPSPYIARYVDPLIVDTAKADLFPSCEDHFNATTAPYPLAKWMWYVQLAPHATMHATVGGTLWSPSHPDAERLFAQITGRDVSATNLNRVVKQHTLYRLRILEYPPDCVGRDVSHCLPSCNTDRWTYHEIGRQIILSQDVSDLFALKTPKNLPFVDDYESFRKRADANLVTYLDSLGNADPDDVTALGEAYCAQPGMSIEGDQKDSSGALDPVFWTIHGTMERLYQFRLLNGVGFYDSAWPNNGACSGSRADYAITHNAAYKFGFEHVAGDRTDLVPADSTTICEGHFAASRMFCGNPESVADQDADFDEASQATAAALTATLTAVPRPRATERTDAALATFDSNHVVVSPTDASAAKPHQSTMTTLKKLYCDEADPSMMARDSTFGRTNLQLLALVDPRNDPQSIDFEYPIYHHFNWDHCDAMGIHFPDLAAQ